MAYVDQLTLRSNASFVGRVTLAMVRAAIQIVNEAPATPRHADRAILATRVLLDSATYGPRFVDGVVCDVTITTATSDAGLDTAVAGIWNGYI